MGRGVSTYHDGVSDIWEFDGVLRAPTIMGPSNTVGLSFARNVASTPCMSINAQSELEFADDAGTRGDISFGTSTGSKIGGSGSEKFAFHGATPTIQETGVAVSAAAIHAALVTKGLITA